MTKASNVILVHGAWADGSSWSKVIPILRKHDLRVTAVQLPLTSLQASMIWRAIHSAVGSDAHRFEMERHVCNGRQFGCGDHCSCNCRWSGGGLCGPGGGKCHRAEQQ